MVFHKRYSALKRLFISCRAKPCYNRKPMSTINEDIISRIATVSALSLEGEQRESIKHDLENIIGYIDQLSQVDTDNVEPTYAVHGIENIMRDDKEIDYGVDTDTLLKNAPNQKQNQIVVPKVLDV